MPPLLAELNALGVPLTAIVEHDLYPTPPDVPLPIATRTNRYYRGCGLTTGPRPSTVPGSTASGSLVGSSTD
jgi:inosose dehydratase